MTRTLTVCDQPPGGPARAQPTASVDLRVVPHVDRERAADEHRRDRRRPAARTGLGERPAREHGASRRLRLGHDDHDHDLRRRRGPTPTRRRCGPPASLDRLLDPDRGHRARGGGHDVGQPALDPEPAVAVEVADVAGAVPARRRVAARDSVAQSCRSGPWPRGADADLAGDAGASVGSPVGAPQRRRARRSRTVDPGRRGGRRTRRRPTAGRASISPS